MTRASVAAVVFALVAVVAGCREEPTIVIKFEPNDLSGAHAATARPADLGAAAVAKLPADMTVVSAKTTAKSKTAECKVATDCVVQPLDCCDCANGGKQHAIPKKQVAAAKAARDAKCKTMACTMMLSTDPSCGQRADCVDGACVMVKKE